MMLSRKKTIEVDQAVFDKLMSYDFDTLKEIQHALNCVIKGLMDRFDGSYNTKIADLQGYLLHLELVNKRIAKIDGRSYNN